MQSTGTRPDIPIIYEDNHILAVSKPQGLLSQEDHTEQPDLLNLCKSYIKLRYGKPGNVFLGLLHRLDKPVSGVMVFAKTSKSASRISEQIRSRKVKKSYLAVLKGNPPKNGVLEHHLLKDSKTNTVKVVPNAQKKSKLASLSFKTLDQKGDLALVDINLKTGRAHQIRVQFAEIGAPVWGDKKYGKPEKGSIALHAYRFELVHPTTKDELSFEAPLPESYPWNQFNV
ncbi:MAG: RluA family pseudouridine synthase [Balneolaceae bacterium]